MEKRAAHALLLRGLFVIVCFAAAARMESQTLATGPRFKSCAPVIPSTQRLVTEDNNSSAEEFMFDFTAATPALNPVESIRVVKYEWRAFTEHPRFQYDETYTVRIRAKQGTEWTAPGPPCTFTLQNNFKLARCAAEISSTQKVVTDDNNSGAARFLFEVATDAGFKNLVTPSIEVGRLQWTAFTQHPQVKYDTPYFIRVRVKNSENHPKWSEHGPVTCATTLRNTFRFTYCPTPMPLSQRLLVGNNSPADAGAYLFEFALDKEFQKPVTAITIAPYQWNHLSQYPQFRYNTEYSVRVRVKQSATDAEWSGEGPVCTFRTEPCPITLAVNAKSTTPPCNNTGGAAATVTGGTPPYTYLWSPGSATTQTLTTVAGGPYTVSVEDARGCRGTAAVSVGTATPLSVCLVTQDVSCTQSNDGVATATPTGGTPPYSYQWSTLPAQFTASASGLPAGLYGVTVTDAAGCSRKATAVVTKSACPP